MSDAQPLPETDLAGVTTLAFDVIRCKSQTTY